MWTKVTQQHYSQNKHAHFTNDKRLHFFGICVQILANNFSQEKKDGAARKHEPQEKELQEKDELQEKEGTERE